MAALEVPEERMAWIFRMQRRLACWIEDKRSADLVAAYLLMMVT